MGCVLCNLIKISEEQEPFPSESARQDFWNELASDIVQYHPELVVKVTKLATTEILEALNAQHQAIDLLFARLIERDKSFFPSKSGPPWEAVQKGNALIQRLTLRKVPEPFKWRESCKEAAHCPRIGFHPDCDICPRKSLERIQKS